MSKLPERLPGQLETDVPWRRVQPDIACSLLSKLTVIDGGMLLRTFEAMRDQLLTLTGEKHE